MLKEGRPEDHGLVSDLEWRDREEPSRVLGDLIYNYLFENDNPVKAILIGAIMVFNIVLATSYPR